MSQVIGQKNLNSEEAIRTLSTQQESFIENQTKCPLCDTTLDIRANTADDSQKIREEAFCPSCNIKTRDKEHFLQ